MQSVSLKGLAYAVISGVIHSGAGSTLRNNAPLRLNSLQAGVSQPGVLIFTAVGATSYSHRSLDVDIYRPLDADAQESRERDEVYVVAARW